MKTLIGCPMFGKKGFGPTYLIYDGNIPHRFIATNSWANTLEWAISWLTEGVTAFECVNRI